MKRLIYAALLMTTTGGAFAADLDRSYPDREYYDPLPRQSYVPAPRVIEERKFVEHHHYYHAVPTRVAPPVYREPHFYDGPRVHGFYRPRVWQGRHGYLKFPGALGHHRQWR